MIENEPNEITLILHSDKMEDKKMQTIVETIATFQVKAIDLKRDFLTETQLAEIASKLDVDISDLLDESYANSLGKNNWNLRQMSGADVLVLVRQNPLLLITPILIIGARAYAYHSAFQMFKEVFNIDGVASIRSANREERR